MGREAIIVGAGVGGLSAAIRLARSGWRVSVYERNSYVGGKMGELVEGGFRWDTGPSVITMRPVLEDLFTAAGHRLEEYLDLVLIEPLTRYFFSDGLCINLANNLSQTLEQIAHLEARDVDGYLSFLAYSARLYRLTAPVFTFGPPPALESLRKISPRDLPRVALQGMVSMQNAISRHVSSPQMKQLLGRFATYVGSSPFECPAMLSVIAHVELNEGIWYPRGGIYSIAQAMEKLGRELGIEFHMNSDVKAIAHRNNERRYYATGIVLQSGESKPADVVITDIDSTTVYEKMLPSSNVFQARWKRLEKLEKSSSGFILLLGVEGQHPELAHHNVFFSEDYRREFFQIFHENKPPDDPTIYVAITSKTDAEHAPIGCENWFVLVNAPADNGYFKMPGNKAAYKDLVLDRLASKGVDVRMKLRIIKAFTPSDLEDVTGARRGSLYGISYNDKLAPFRRPSNRCPEMKNLYFVGGTTHPGGGVPMVMLSAKVVSDMICEDE